VAAPKKKKPAAPKPVDLTTELAVKAVLNDAQGQIGACVLDNSPPGSLDLLVRAKVMINSAGQLMGATLVLVPEGPTAEKTRKCIDAVLQGLTWPRSMAPMVTLEREWNFRTDH
jgi:hypothetical protein